MITWGDAMNKLTWQAVILLAVLAGAVVALATLTDWSPAEILGAIGVLAGVGTGAVVGGAQSHALNGTVETIAAETTRQTEKIETIERRTNGELDARIAAAMEEAAEMGAARAIAAMQDAER